MKKAQIIPWRETSEQRDRAERIESAIYEVLAKHRIRPNARLALSEELAEAAATAVDHVSPRSVDSEPFDPRGYFVYVLWGDHPRQAVYVGQSTNILARLGTHLGNREKRELTHRVEVIRCRDRWQMEQMEVRLIRRHRPLLNITRYGGVA